MLMDGGNFWFDPHRHFDRLIEDENFKPLFCK
jgi:hypothetical protein